LARRWTHNFSLTAIGQATAYGLAALTPAATAWFAQYYQLGILSKIDTGLLVGFALTLFAYELIGYVTHFLFHKVPVLWRIHAVHHNDVELDISSTYRHHPLEILITYVITLPVILLLGPPVLAVLLYQSVRGAMHVLAHSNIYIPEVINRWLQYFIVTPDFHRLHHCSDRTFTDSNYGTVSPWLDYLFGTASRRPFAEQETMELGLEYAREPRDSRIDQMLMMPFKRYDRVMGGDSSAVEQSAPGPQIATGRGQ
jgi:sterol desaturase/sphingolipid hydroxylase (fatty acid hydroxylase superfamily)